MSICWSAEILELLLLIPKFTFKTQQKKKRTPTLNHFTRAILEWQEQITKAAPDLVGTQPSRTSSDPLRARITSRSLRGSKSCNVGISFSLGPAPPLFHGVFTRLCILRWKSNGIIIHLFHSFCFGRQASFCFGHQAMPLRSTTRAYSSDLQNISSI